ncbi:uncharacterized protein [Oscarella lobularis]|uniref:uncharacterized protein n=1 Tax=Oscarella lobularis TaxID=121494 RepID=UPI0033135FA7
MSSFATHLLACFFLSAARADELSIDFNNAIGMTSDGYVSFNFDWHLNSEESPAWYNSSVLVLDLKNPQLVYLASQLSPGHLRVGGSEGDVAIYDVGTHSPCKPGFCMSMDRWHELVEFCQAAKIRLVFGLNAMYGRKNKTSHFDSTNTQALLEYTAKNKLPVYGFEFGNELQSKIDPSYMADDYITIRQMINELWPDSSTRPWLIGPDENPNEDFLKKLLQKAGYAMNASTYHIYPGYGLDPHLPQQILTSSYLNKEGSLAAKLGKDINETAPNVEGWVGETAAAWHSGRNGTTNTFLSGFWYLDALASVASQNQKAFCRQTLVGGNYELLNKNTTDPYPDYFTALLFKRLMGMKFLQVKANISDDLRVYAACSNPEAAEAGAVTTAFLNINNSTSFSFTIAGLSGDQADREEFHLSSGEEGTLQSSTVKLNNKILQLQDGKLPDMSGMSQSRESPIVVKPLTYGYILFKNANAAVCSKN